MPSPIDRPGSRCCSVRTRATGSTAPTFEHAVRGELARDPAAEPTERSPSTPGAVDDGISSARSASGSQTHVPARSSAVVSTSWVRRRKSAADVTGDA